MFATFGAGDFTSEVYEVLHNVDRLPVYHEVRGSAIATVVELGFFFSARRY